MAVLYDIDNLHVGTFGTKVPRATANLPQGTSETLFTITGGRVAMTLILGEVTSAVEAVANATKLTYTVSGGGAVDVTATTDITGNGVGVLYTADSFSTDPLRGRGSRLYPTDFGGPPFIFRAGVIDLDCAGSATGQVRWDIFYLALDDGARIVAA